MDGLGGQSLRDLPLHCAAHPQPDPAVPADLLSAVLVPSLMASGKASHLQHYPPEAE